MAIITKIAVQKKNQERFMVYIEKENGEEVALSVDQDVLIQFRLKKGMEIDELDLQEIVYADEVQKAYHTALYFLSYRMRSEKEIIDYLKKKGIAEAVIRDVLHKLRENRYVNDREFAYAYVRTQKQTTTKGPVVIRSELEKFGIAEEWVEESLQLFTFEEQLEVARKLYEKAKKQQKKLSSQQWKQHVRQLLHRKGFSQNVIDHIIVACIERQDDEQEWEALEYHGRKAHRRYEKYDGYVYEQKMKQALYRKGFPLDMIERFLQLLKEEQS
ncbi:recombination regulator RecX [Thermaerobacillus caldiproteolyticus]|uniref:recombination regulator RecX n=1 Tax=Thermaerobacillus caldiproteolyticus TaxID=247480 RepID=UPI00188BD6B4|nr:recombination regulator RecX [Anoxybacillus caldiproteolyticus]QPA31372.1 recombination regulator RecX [Anoxybacillus caldiproteolyticus]